MQAEDLLLAKLKVPLSAPRNPQSPRDTDTEDASVFTRALGAVSKGKAFFIPASCVQPVDPKSGEIQEDDEVRVIAERLPTAGKDEVTQLVEGLTSTPHSTTPTSSIEVDRESSRGSDPTLGFDSPDTNSDHPLGLDPGFWHYLIPFGLRILDTHCYAVKLDRAAGPSKTYLLPHKFLRPKVHPKESDRRDSNAVTPRHAVASSVVEPMNLRQLAYETAQVFCCVRAAKQSVSGLFDPH